jgi:hypothetical protein
MDFKLAIIIINYKTPGLVIDCLCTLLPELELINSKVVIVDNDSADDSVTALCQWISENDLVDKVKLIPSKHNSGFSGGNNEGLKSVKADYYLLLNSDTLLRKGSISKLLDAAKQNPDAGLISPRLEWKDETPQESCFRFHTPFSELISSAATSFVTRILSSFIVAQPVVQKSDYYQWTSFACVLIRSEVLEQIGLMDDGFFMYYEDVEFCYRAKKNGWRILNVPEARVVHLRGGSSPVKSNKKLRKRLPRYYYESRTRYFYLVYGYSGLFAANALWSIGWLIALLRTSTSKSYELKISKYQWKDIWINFFTPLKQYIHPENYDKT